jgi:nicotinate-nucleotide pyrophosphorylase (carboxylating)
MVKVEVEVDTLQELEEALRLGVDAVLLDNMSPNDLRLAVSMAKGKVLTEASGGITPENASSIAAAGVDIISIGWITHSAPALDVALDF